jgi:hypothetical protein
VITKASADLKARTAAEAAKKAKADEAAATGAHDDARAKADAKTKLSLRRRRPKRRPQMPRSG